ncbi:hypothetical protein BT96DRAFT_944135 [Gymnopus androsaceus JB14]|uniref:JmjC domain-containing protein n=1 Tax=Gymnopus androsaceus JB14 TaxID=1447944 RepID=A0A6A4H6Y2_9AGAR|nr:hypothetical protein BT96DRAFT_944135 [Gymnopus androsaceus JB14]
MDSYLVLLRTVEREPKGKKLEVLILEIPNHKNVLSSVQMQKYLMIQIGDMGVVTRNAISQETFDILTEVYKGVVKFKSRNRKLFKPDTLFMNELRLSREKVEVSNRGKKDYWDTTALMCAWFNRQYAEDPNAPYPSVLEIHSRLQHNGLNDIGLKWGQETTSSTPILDAEDSMTTAWTLLGNLTEPHTDGFGYWIRVVHWKGTKLWVLWPPTLHNLQHIKCDIAFKEENDTRIEYYIKNLEGMEIYLVQTNDDDPVAFELPPSTIRACVSIDTCSHSSLSVWRKEGLEAAKVCNQFMMNCWKDWCSARGKFADMMIIGNEEHNALNSIEMDEEERWNELSIGEFGEWKRAWFIYEERRWKQLAQPKSNICSQSESKEILDWVKTINKFLDNIPDLDN